MLGAKVTSFVTRRTIGCCRWNRSKLSNVPLLRRKVHALSSLPLLQRKHKVSTEEITYAPGQSLRVMVKPEGTEWTSFCSSLCAQQTEAFNLVDLTHLFHSHQLWMKNMPHIRPYYAVKANDHPAIIKILASFGCGFDCASRGEVEKVLSFAVNPNSIVYANTHKQPDHIQFAASQGVHWYTFDSENEIQKMAELDPFAKLLVRLKVDNPQSVTFQPGKKFGVTVLEACSLVKSAKDHGLAVNGVCFHIGNCVDPSVYARALEMTRTVFDYATDELGLTLSVVDIGGGFVDGEKQEAEAAYKQAATVINESAEKVFAAYPDVKLIAEPGRFFVQSTTCSFTQVIGKRRIAVEDGKEFWYYLNDGLYGSFLGHSVYDDLPSQPSLLKEGNGALYRSKLYGPTCCPHDIITDAVLPELNSGDWLYFKEMGAYTAVSTTTFNGFPHPRSFFTVAEDTLDDLKMKLK